MTFNDDEPIVAPADVSGTGDNEGRSAVDLVTVLDVSGSMQGHKLEKLKIAMQFLIRKLSPIDRLSVVTFSNNSSRLFPLRQITEKSQEEIIKQVNALVAAGNTNIADGLKTGLQVLNDRRLNDGRVGAIMLMSDGEQNIGDATQIRVDNFPVHTFGFGANAKPQVLQAIATNSKGGTFSDVQNQDNLSIAFSQCLGGLLTVVVQDLNLTIKQFDGESKIEKVFAGNYPQTRNNDGSITISFGELYNREVRKVMVDLLLPAVESEKNPDVLVVSYTYRTGKGTPAIPSPPTTATVSRTGEAVEKEREEVIVEESRLQTVDKVKEARGMADVRKLEEAKDKVVEAENSLDDVDIEEPNQVIETLKYEMQQLFKHMRTQDVYETQGRPYALSFETSHERQRYAARGDPDKVRTFATPRMDAYLEQAKEFDKDTTKPPPSAADDVKQERLADPFGPIVRAVSFYIKIAIEALKSIDKILNSTRTT
ncbi:hypothetical protein TIFTF001_015098 [Ficus carica]|uniref:VWFA domain-containing protein n=1 Tax=Ficus carica TaxID=3494 RepID=A0AA88A790_FICCA|nr:hypothetical protein TIFTF001_015098 [Ficus carica]